MSPIRNLYQKGLVTLILALGILILGTCVAIQPGIAHSRAITECSDNIIYTEAVFVRDWLDEGKVVYWAEAYDTNGDGVKNVVTLSHITSLVMDPTNSHVIGYKHNPNPLYWLVDLNYDNVPDKAYIDINGNGDCHDIKLYKNLRSPGAMAPDFNSSGGATI